MREAAVSRALASSDAAEAEVEVVGDTDGARAFWQAFASIAAELLDGGDLPGDDHAIKEAAAA